MAEPKNFPATFARLKKILQRYAKRLTVTVDKPDAYSLDAGYSEKFKRTMFFGAAQIKKNYVSLYLMPVYVFPDLLKDISPALKKRMQGKSCFNFTAIDDAMVKEVAELTKQGFERYKAEGWLSEQLG